MAKRKRLTPARPEFLQDGSGAQDLSVTDQAGAAPEAKSMFPQYRDGFVGHGLVPASPAPSPAVPAAPPVARRAPPIADVARAEAAEAALNEVGESLRIARAEGRLIQSLPLTAIDAAYLVRDRIAVDDSEMAALKDSLRRRGQQTPIEVTALPDGRYGLISGWRRLRALRELHEEAGESEAATVLAVLRSPETAADAYLAMVEENEIRVGLSFYERARIVAKAVEHGVYASEKAALQDLFRAASRAKRSKVKTFLSIVAALDGTLGFPEAMSERAGLALAKALAQDSGVQGRIAEALARATPSTAEAEQAVISACISACLQGAALAAKQTLKAGLESNSESKIEVGPQLVLRVIKDGSLSLRGAALTADLRARLIEWLRTQTQ